MPRRAALPWSALYDEKGTDSPVNDQVPLSAEAQINLAAAKLDAKTGEIFGYHQSDRRFIFQDPNQAVAAGATLQIDPINMLEHDILILGILDSSGNNINVDIRYMLSSSPSAGSPYDNAIFLADGITSSKEWTINQVNSAASDVFFAILNDLSENLATTWTFYKMIGAKGTIGNMNIRSNEGANAGTLSTAYIRFT